MRKKSTRSIIGIKKIDNRKIDFYFTNYLYMYIFFLFFTGGCNFKPCKKMEQDVGQEKKLQIEVVQN